MRLRGLWLSDPQMDRPAARRADHPDLADRLGSGLARLARRDAQSAALCGDAARPALPPAAYAAAAQAALGARRAGRCRSAIPSMAAARSWSSPRGAPQPGAARPARTNVWLDPADGARARQGVERCRAGPRLPRPARQPDGAGLGADDRRLGRRLHVRLLPHRHLAVVADHRQREARLPLEAAEFDQRQSPPSDRLLDRCCRWRC